MDMRSPCSVEGNRESGAQQCEWAFTPARCATRLPRLARESRRVSRRERLSERYRQHHRTSRSPEFVYGGDERVELFRRYVGGPGRRVLDLGCRYGALTSIYATGNQVVGLDVDREALQQAATLGIETQWADVEEGLPFEDETFDVVVAGELLEHLREPDALIRESHRVLRPGGTFIGSVPNAYRLKNRVRFLAGLPPETDPTHLHLFRPSDIERMLGCFESVELDFIASRFLGLHRRLFGNDLVFHGYKSDTHA
jgi:SAM-dependent methyltransferase